LLAERGDVEGLRARIEVGDWYAADRVAGLLVERADVEAAVAVVRVRATTDHGTATQRLANLPSPSDVEDLDARAEAADDAAAWRLVELLGERVMSRSARPGRCR
jgi:hypothetical protein